MLGDRIVPSEIARDTLFYKVLGGKLETVRFIQAVIIEGASVPSWDVRKIGGSHQGRRVFCDPDFYHATQKKAWEEEVRDLESGIQSANQQITDLAVEISQERKRLKRAREMVRRQIRKR